MDFRIDPKDRTWYINDNILGGFCHQEILKENYKDQWDNLVSIGYEPADIQEILENRLIKTNVIKIGELNEFYVELNILDEKKKQKLKDFCKTIIKIRPETNSKIMMLYQTNSIIECTVKEISEAYLDAMLI